MSMSRTNKRLALFMGFSVVFLVALFGRTFYVQVIAAPGLQETGRQAARPHDHAGRPAGHHLRPQRRDPGHLADDGQHLRRPASR